MGDYGSIQKGKLRNTKAQDRVETRLNVLGMPMQNTADRCIYEIEPRDVVRKYTDDRTWVAM